MTNEEAAEVLGILAPSTFTLLSDEWDIRVHAALRLAIAALRRESEAVRAWEAVKNMLREPWDGVHFTRSILRPGLIECAASDKQNEDKFESTYADTPAQAALAAAERLGDEV